MNLLRIAPMLALLFTACEQPPDPLLTTNPLLSALDLSVDAVARAYMQDPDHVGLSIGIWQDSQAYIYGYGESARGNGMIPDAYTVFEIGSISKTFTAAMLTSVLAERGLAMETPIRLLLPADIPTLEKDGQEIRVLDLLNHTSGLPRLPDDLSKGYDRLDPYAHYDSTRVYAFLKQHKLKRKPGTELEYSNLGLGLAGLILERLTGQSYAQNLSARIAQPLGMVQTAIEVPAGSDMALGYNKRGNEVPYWDLAGLKGAGAIRASTSDMLLYGKAQLGGAPVPLDSIFDAGQTATFESETVSVGLGWFMITVNERRCAYHDGGTGGFSSFIYVCPATAQVLVILTNSSDPNGTQTLGIEMGNAVIQ